MHLAQQKIKKIFVVITKSLMYTDCKFLGLMEEL
jgi:hypothetical protein